MLIKDFSLFKSYLRQDRSAKDFKFGNSCLRRELLLALLSPFSTLPTLRKNIEMHNLYASNPYRNTKGIASIITKLDLLHPILLVDVVSVYYSKLYRRLNEIITTIHNSNCLR